MKKGASAGYHKACRKAPFSRSFLQGGILSNFLNLEYFLVVAEELSFTKASQRLFISQQSLSNHIQKLEEYFETSLFLRTTPLTLTPSGVYLCEKARQLLMFRDNLCQELQDIDRFDRGTLTIGSTHSRFLLPTSIDIFHHKFPNIELRLFEGTTPQVEEQLHKGALDLSIGFLPSDVSHLTASHQLFTHLSLSSVLSSYLAIFT